MVRVKGVYKKRSKEVEKSMGDISKKHKLDTFSGLQSDLIDAQKKLEQFNVDKFDVANYQKLQKDMSKINMQIAKESLVLNKMREPFTVMQQLENLKKRLDSELNVINGMPIGAKIKRGKQQIVIDEILVDIEYLDEKLTNLKFNKKSLDVKIPAAEQKIENLKNELKNCEINLQKMDAEIRNYIVLKEMIKNLKSTIKRG